ncbi:hypothetical protein WG947_06095 [Pontibacter sp. H259]|uniref:hypothetical protein n=1 Tax=Pontibacter sp. H259 TaxID=3133421 RepID=UPI0030C49890
MEPEEVDKLFNERLGRMAPTPPADLWNRLQDRIEAEMPPKHEEKRRFGFLYYSIAAAIALLIAVGVVLKFQQPQTIDNQTIANVDVTKPANQPAQTITPERTTEQSIAAVTPQESIAEPTITEQPTIVTEAEKPVTKKQFAPKVKVKKEDRWVKVETQPATMLAQQTTKPATPKAEPEQSVAMHTPVAFASANSAEPVEITIKRTVNREEMALASAAESEESSSFQRKQQLAKNIFKQVKNLSNGEKINLEEVGLNADRIALETRIGRQKISKVINL